jgi:pyrroloquinoline quinone biosynthesis protein E
MPWLRLASGQRVPLSVTLVLTHRCDLACDHCDIRLDARSELDAGSWKMVLEHLSALGMRRASFSGGEATLRPDLPALVAHAKSLGLTTSLNTNAWTLRDHLGSLLPFLDMLVVSLDGSAEVHDARRGRAGAFARALEALRIARQAGICTASITALGRDDLHLVDGILGLARDLGFWAFFQPNQQSCLDARMGLVTGFDARMKNELASLLAHAKSRGLPVGASAAYLRRLRRPGARNSCARCRAGRAFATILPDGTLVPCHLMARAGTHPSVLLGGPRAAWRSLPEVRDGPGCFISPYLELDEIFRFNPRAIAAALKRSRPFS